MSTSPKREMIGSFFEEVESYIPSLNSGIESLKANSEQPEILEETHRLVHTIKGAAAMIGVSGLSHIASQMEEALDDVIAAKMDFTEDLFQEMTRTINTFQDYCQHYFNGGVDSRSILRDTFIQYHRLRNIPAEEFEEDMGSLLNTVPEREACESENTINGSPEQDSIQQGTQDHSEDDFQIMEVLSDPLPEAEVIVSDSLEQDSIHRGAQDHSEDDFQIMEVLSDPLPEADATISDTFAQDSAQQGMQDHSEDDSQLMEVLSDPLQESNTQVAQQGSEPETNPDYQQEEIIPELLESFYQEADEHIEDLSGSLGAIEAQITGSTIISAPLREEIRKIRRSVHTLKGASAVIGFQTFSSFAHKFEDLLDWLYEAAEEISPEVVEVLIQASDQLERIIREPQEAYSQQAVTIKNRFFKIAIGVIRTRIILS